MVKKVLLSEFLIVAPALSILTLGIYAGVLSHSFVAFDDLDYVVNNEWVRTGLSIENLSWAFSSLNANVSYWHPLTWLSHQIDCELFGSNAGSHKLVSALIHSINASLLYLFFRRLQFSTWTCLVITGLFAWHPLRVESVAWVSERKDLLCSLFTLITFHAYFNYTERPSAWRMLVVFVSFVSALMSKPMAVTIPALLILLDFWPLRRMKFGSRFQDLLQIIFIEKLPLLTLSIAISILTVIAQNSLGIVANTIDIPVAYRLANALASLWIYLLDFAYPVKLVAFYPYPNDFSLWPVLLSLTAFVLVTAVAIKFRSRFPHLFVGWIWYVLTLLPVIGLIQVGDQARADRYTYLSNVGILLPIAGSLTWLHCVRPRLISVFIGLLGTFMITITLQQIGYWKNSQTLFRRVLEHRPNSTMIRLGMIATLDRETQQDEVFHHLHRALQNEPESPHLHRVAASLYRHIGKIEAELIHLRKSLYWDPTQPTLQRRLAYILSAHPDPAIRRPNEAVSLAEAAHSNAKGASRESFDTWAIAEASRGHFSAARDLASRATQGSSAEVPTGMLHRLKLFDSSRPYIDYQLPARTHPGRHSK